MTTQPVCDVVIVGGGPAGLSAALALGRARRRVVLCDAGPRRNATAEHLQNFVTRDGTPPAEFRRIGRQQLEPYNSVEVRDAHVADIRGEKGAFSVTLTSPDDDAAEHQILTARRMLLCTGMIDVLPDIDGFRALWGRSIFICPYCHAWEVQDRRFGYLAPAPDLLEFALFLRGWTGHVTALTDGRFAVPDQTRERLVRGGVGLEERQIARLRTSAGDRLTGVEFVGEDHALDLDVLFARPPQQHVPIVGSLGLTLDAAGCLQVNEHLHTSRAGVYAAGDLVTANQGAVLAAASGMLAAAALNRELTTELAVSGALQRAPA